MPNLVSGVPGGDFRVRLGVDVGIDAQRDGRALAHGARHLVQRFEFRLAFDIELIDAGLERRRAFRLWSCRRRRTRSCAPGMPAASAFFNSPPETTSAPAPSLRQRLQHREIAVGLDRKGDQRAFRQGVGEDAVMALQRRRRIAIERRADARGQLRKIDVFGMKPPFR